MKNNKRKKTVFSNNQLVHVFASQKQDSGRGSNMFFSGTKIYSYGLHFCAANIVSKDIVLINADGYSNTTQKHLSKIRGAFTHKTLIAVPCVSNPDDSENMLENKNYLVSEIVDSFTEILTGRSRLGYRLRRLHEKIKTHNTFTDFYKLSDKIQLDSETLAVLGAIAAIGERNDKLKDEKRRQDWLDRDAIAEKKLMESIDDWKNFRGPIQGYSNRVFLRVNLRDKTVETSRGAVVPVADALALINAVNAGTARVGNMVGNYRLDKISKDVLTIGCHVINLSEVNAVLGNLAAPSADAETNNNVLPFGKVG